MLDDLKNIFKSGNFVAQVILICAVVFLIENIVSNISPAAGHEIFRWFAMHSYLPSVLTSPWSVVTYMFFHGSIGHIFWNMVIFYWFGRIVMDFTGRERLIGLYFLGGIAGGLFYLLVYTLMMLGGEGVIDVPLVGASAAIMAVVVFAGFRFGDYQMNLLLLGPVKLRYIALGLFVINTLLDLSMNTGGKMSHLGGAAMGYLYHRSLASGSDYALSLFNLWKRFTALFQKGPKMRVVKNESQSKQRSSNNSSTNDAEMQAKTDAILDKISKSGYENLSAEEKEFLFKMSKKNQ